MGHGKEANAFRTEDYRSYLHYLAGLHMSPALRGKLDPSDLVQETMLKSHEKKGQFRGKTEEEWKAWLRKILSTTMVDAFRRHHSKFGEKEGSLENALQESSFRLEQWLAAPPLGDGEHLKHLERLNRLTDALMNLPQEQREAIELRYLRHSSLPEIQKRIGRTYASVAGLLRRGLIALRAALEEGQ